MLTIGRRRTATLQPCPRLGVTACAASPTSTVAGAWYALHATVLPNAENGHCCSFRASSSHVLWGSEWPKRLKREAASLPESSALQLTMPESSVGPVRMQPIGLSLGWSCSEQRRWRRCADR